MFKFIYKPQSAALAFLIAGAFWFVIGTGYGMFSAINLISPEFFSNIPWLVHGRVRPVHTNTVIYGFVLNLLFGCGLYYFPALLKTKLWSESLGWFSFAGWNLAVLSGPITFAFGLAVNREYTEYLWIFDVTIILAVLAMILNLIMTIFHRKEQTLYVSTWYFLATFLWTSGVYFIGNVMWRPGSQSMPGILDSVYLWFYGHNLPGLLLTPVALGAAYFVLPRVTKTPLYSHTLSHLGYWTLVAMYTHIGAHHIMQAPIPNFLKVMAAVSSVGMVIPVATVLVNLWMTARGKGAALLSDPAGRLVNMGLIWYLLTCIQGPVQSLAFMQRVTHFNNWTIGHSHIAVLGFSGFIALGGLWHVLPLITKRPIYSSRLVNLQFGLVMLGLIGFFVVLTIAGLVQGEAWNNGETVYRVLPEITPYMILRGAFGVCIFTGAIIGFVNLLLSILPRPVKIILPAREREAVP